MDICCCVDNESLPFGAVRYTRCTIQLFFSTLWKSSEVISDCVPSHMVEFSPSTWSRFSSSLVFGSLRLGLVCSGHSLHSISFLQPLCLYSRPLLPFSAPLLHSQRERLVFPGLGPTCGSSLALWSFVASSLWRSYLLPTLVLSAGLAYPKHISYLQVFWDRFLPSSPGLEYETGLLVVLLPLRLEPLSLHSVTDLIVLVHSGRQKLLFPLLKGSMFPRAFHMIFNFQVEKAEMRMKKAPKCFYPSQLIVVVIVVVLLLVVVVILAAAAVIIIMII